MSGRRSLSVLTKTIAARKNHFLRGTQNIFPPNEAFFFRQLFDMESCTYTYLLADALLGEAVLIDPVLDMVNRDAMLVRNLGFQLKYVINTHVHADHITGTGKLKEIFPHCRSVISEASGATADILLREPDPTESPPNEVMDGDSEDEDILNMTAMRFGDHELTFLNTPGHTNGCMTFVCAHEAMVFTGDTLLIRGCGRTDFQEGDPQALYRSVHDKIYTLPLNFRIYPGHDYRGMSSTTIWEERQYNPRLTKTEDEFIFLMNNLNLPMPKKMQFALPANLQCGVQDSDSD